MAKREKAPRVDGFGPAERKRIDQVVRTVWYQSKARATAVKRCTDKKGFTVCEKCKKRTPKIKIDHIIPCGPVDSDGYIKRMFVPSAQLSALCHPCHKPKTKREAAARAKEKRGFEKLRRKRDEIWAATQLGVSSDTSKKPRNFIDDF